MKLKNTIEKLEDVEEDLRQLYEKKDDGKFHLRFEVEGTDDNSGLHKALVAERKAKADLEKKIKKWEAIGKTDEEIAALIAKAEEFETTRLTQAGEWEKLREQMNTKHAEALAAKDRLITAKDTEVKAMRTTLESHLIDAQATAAIAAAKGVPDLLLPHVKRHVKVVEENGKYATSVVDAKGDPLVNNKGEPLGLSEFVLSMKENPVYGRAFDGEGQSGSGMQPGNGGGGSPPMNVKKSDFKSEKDRSAFVDKHGLAVYQKLPA